MPKKTSYESVFEVAAQLSVGLVDTPVAPSEGEGLDGVPGVGQDDCITVNVCPAIITVPVRWLVRLLAATA